MWEDIREFLSHTLLTIGKTQLTVSSILILVVFWIVVMYGLKLLEKSIYSIKSFNEGKKYSIFALIKYIILVIVIVMSLQIVGINLTVLMAGSAALLVGLGLGIQNLFSDYISGIIILVDSSLKIGDVIEINNIMGNVEEIKLRTTTIRTTEDKYIILPNTDLTRHEVINWTHNQVASRFKVTIGVDYKADVDLVTKLLLEAVHEEPMALNKPEPFVRLNDFADSALLFSVYFWVEDVFHVEKAKSDIRYSILKKFRENDLNIPFPQRVVHNIVSKEKTEENPET